MAFRIGLFGGTGEEDPSDSRISVRIIAGSKSDAFPVRDGLRQGCPLSPILFIIFMDRISRRSQGVEGYDLATSESGLCFLRMMWFC